MLLGAEEARNFDKVKGASCELAPGDVVDIHLNHKDSIPHSRAACEGVQEGTLETVVREFTSRPQREKTMPYIQKETKAGRTILFGQYYSGRYGKKGRGSPAKKKTPEQMELSNYRRQEKELTKLMNANFRPTIDQHLVLEWGRDKDPPEDSAAMKKQMARFIRRLRRAYRARGQDPRYIYTMEVGPRGSRHIHMVLSEPDLKEVQRLWEVGPVHGTPLYPDGNYQKLAAYFMKYSKKTEETEGQKLGRRWNASLNLKRPEPRTRIIAERTFLRDFPKRKGYRIDQDSVRAAEPDTNGRLFRECIYVKIDPEPQRKRRWRDRE